MRASKWRSCWASRAATGLAILVVSSAVAVAADGAGISAEEDQQMMLATLGITKLRSGVAADQAAPNAANYDEVRANPYPLWPDPLVDSKQRKVTTQEMWWAMRRPELLEVFEREIYGRIPANVPRVTWNVEAADHEVLGTTPIVATRLTGHVDNSAYREVSVEIPMLLLKPEHPRGRMPVLIMFQFGPLAFPAPAQPSAAELERINAALKKQMVAQDPSLAAVLAAHPAWQPVTAPPRVPPAPDVEGNPPPLQQLMADGWAVVLLEPNAIQPDTGAGLRRGIIGLTSHGQPRKPDEWGVLRAWAWGASRAVDYLTTQPDIDERHIGIDGVSRYGKAALVAMAFDMRFAMALVASSGEGGAKPHRRNFGEAVENLAASGEYHWMAGNFLRYAAAEGKSGAKNANDLPVDSGELIALCAPRWTFISYGSPEHGDPPWVDQRGSFMAAVQAGKVYRLLGAHDLGVGDDYQHAQLPPEGKGLLQGELAWREHLGGHTDAPNIKSFLAWADRLMGRDWR